MACDLRHPSVWRSGMAERCRRKSRGNLEGEDRWLCEVAQWFVSIASPMTRRHVQLQRRFRSQRPYVPVSGKHMLLHLIARFRSIRGFGSTLAPEPLEHTSHRPLHTLSEPLTRRHESNRQRYKTALAGIAGPAVMSAAVRHRSMKILLFWLMGFLCNVTS